MHKVHKMRRSVHLHTEIEKMLLQARGDLIYEKKKDYDMTDSINYFILMGVHRYWEKQNKKTVPCNCEKNFLEQISEKPYKEDGLIDEYESLHLERKYEKKPSSKGQKELEQKSSGSSTSK